MKISILNGKVFSNKNVAIVKKLILDCFEKQSNWYRKPLINECVSLFGLSEQETKDKSYNSIFTKCKSLVGSVINEMIADGYLFLTDAKVLVLLIDIKVILKEDEITNYLGSLLKKKEMTRDEIISCCVKKYKTDKTKTQEDDLELINLIDNILNKYLTKSVIKKENLLYSFVSTNKTGLDCVIQNIIENSKVDSLHESLVKAISVKGGEFFEAFSVKILTEYYKHNNNKILTSKVTGGSSDNGIDGIIEYQTLLDNKVLVLMQAKARTSTQVTLKEVREFYGAFKSQNGTLGIFTTNTTYHNEAKKFAENLDDLILIDGKKFEQLCILTKTAVKKYKNKYILDKEIFLEENFI